MRRGEIRAGREGAYIIFCRLLLAQEEKTIEIRRMLRTIGDMALSRQNIRLLQETLLQETLLLKGIQEEVAENGRAAEEHLFTALKKGYIHGYYQVFVDEGSKITPILLRLLSNNALISDPGFLEYAQDICVQIAPQRYRL